MLKHRTLLKSMLDFTGDKKELAYITDNFNFLLKTNIEFKSEEHAPSYGRILKKFEEDPDTLEEIVKISKETSLYATNFKSLVSEVFEEQQQKKLITLLKETSKISEAGVKLNKEYIKGPRQAVEYFLHKSTDFIKSEVNVQSQGSLKEDSHTAEKSLISPSLCRN